MTFGPDLIARAQAVVAGFAERGWRLATAESCTGGLIAALLTEVPGSSAVVERGFVTYSNEAKVDLLDVPAALITSEGAVSEAAARAMAEGAMAHSQAQVAVAVTGIAGPGGGTPTKPVGLVHLALAAAGRPTIHEERRYGDLGRSAVRGATVADALALLEALLSDQH